MNKEQMTEILHPFLTALAQSLGDVFSQFTGSEWKLALSPGQPLERHLPDGAAENAAPAGFVFYKLHFTGGMDGRLTLQLSREQAVGLAAQILGEAAETALQDFDAKRSEALLEAVRAALKKCAASLALERGTVSVKAGSSEELKDSPAAYSFNVSEGGSARPDITVYFSSQLVDSLAKASEPPATQEPAPPENPESEPAMPVESSTPPAAASRTLDEGQLNLIMDVELNVTLRFGQRQLSLREIMELTSGSVVELDRQVDEPVELLLDGKVIARGEAVIVDGNYGLRVTEILQPMQPALMN